MMLVAGCYLFVHWGCSWTAFPLPIPAGVALQWSSLVSSCPLCMPFVVKAISVLNANTEANCLVRSSRKQEKSLKDWIPEEFSGLMVLVDLTGLGLTGNCHIARFQERRQSILGLTVLKQTKKSSETYCGYSSVRIQNTCSGVAAVQSFVACNRTNALLVLSFWRK